MTKVNEDQVRGGLDVDDIIKLVDVGGTPGLPAVDGSNLINLQADIGKHRAASYAGYF